MLNRTLCHRLCATILICLGPVIHEIARADDNAASVDNYLAALEGRWDMSGTLLGKPVRYRARGERVLRGGFVRLHMIDAASPPQYEAAVYVGFDAGKHDYVAHWLDLFGAAGARVVATGKRDGQRLVIVFPYEDGAFRDTFVRDDKLDRWSLLLESQAKDGTWSTFASYALVRPKK